MDSKIIKRKRKNLTTKIFLINILVYAFFCIILNKLVNFPGQFNKIVFQIEIIKAPLICYFIGVAIIAYIIELVILKLLTKNINKFISSKEETLNNDELIKFRNECMSMPYKFMVINLAVVVVIDVAVFILMYALLRFFITNFEDVKIFYLRIGMIASAIWILSSTFSYNFVQKFANDVLNASYENNQYYFKNKLTISNTFNIVIQIIPILATALIIFMNFSYTNTINTYSKNIASYYDVAFSNVTYDETLNSTELLSYLQDNIVLWDEENLLFVVDYEGNAVSKIKNGISDFMLDYLNNYFYYYTDENGKQGIDLTLDSNVIYDSYGIDEHAYVKVLRDSSGRKIYVGVKYFAGSKESFSYLMYSGIAILVVYAVIIVGWAKSNSSNMKKLEKYMEAILSEKDILKKNFMPIMSNDELGNVSYYYNKIQEKLLTQRDIMFKQEQLSVLRRACRWNGT